VTQIVQDDRGFMWFATQYGLDRYDGYSFKSFVHNPRNPDSLAGVYISTLFKDRSGRLWIGGSGGGDRLDPVTEHFMHFAIAAEGEFWAMACARPGLGRWLRPHLSPR